MFRNHDMGRKDLRIPIWPHLYYGSSLVLSYDTQGRYCGQKNKRRTSRWQNGFQEPTYHFLPILASCFWETHKLPVSTSIYSNYQSTISILPIYHQMYLFCYLILLLTNSQSTKLDEKWIGNAGSEKKEKILTEINIWILL